MPDDRVTPLDVDARFEELKKSIPAAMQDILTVEGRTRLLRPRRVWIEDLEDAQAVDKRKLKETKLNQSTWKTPVYADLEYVDKSTGKVVSRSQKVRVADLPRPTPHQSFLIDGTEYHPRAQWRLKPGVYTREKENGEVGAQFNFAKGGKSRLNFWLDLDPDNGLFYIKIAQARVGLYPVLSALGVSDDEIVRHWGSDLLSANRAKFKKNPDAEVNKLFRVIYRESTSNIVEAVERIRDYFEGAALDGDTTKMTLGKSFQKVTPESLLLASKKMVDVNKGRAEQDDRDSLRFKNLLTYDDHVIEKLQRSKRAIQNKLKYRIESKETPKEAVLRADINRPILQHLTGITGLASSSEQLNPVAIFADNNTVVSTGEGGIADLNIVTDAARSVHSSHMGFVDPIPTSQSKMAGVALKMALGARKKGTEPVTSIYDRKLGKVVYLTPSEVYDEYVAMPDQFTFKGGKARPVAAKISAQKGDKREMVSESQVRYFIVNAKSMFSINSALLPFLSSASGNRALMAANFFEQAVPLADPDTPLVQSHLTGGKSAERVVGELFSTLSKESGTVAKVEKDRIAVRGKDNKLVWHSLYDNYPFNTGFIDSKTNVKVGDVVKKGDLLADTNFSKGGELAIGKNLRTGYMSMKGYGFEDAIVVSDSAAQKLTSEHIHRFSAQLDENNIANLKRFNAAFPNSMSNAQRSKLDADGVIKKGQKVTTDDVLIALLTVEQATPEDIALGRVYRKLAKPWRDRSTRWGNDFDGVVTDVSKTPGQITVYVRTKERLRVGDKLVGRHGNKGVVSAIIADAEMPRNKDGEHVEIAMNPLGVPSRMNPSQIHETAAGKAAKLLGHPIMVDNFEEKTDNVTFTQRALKQAGLKSDKEELFDPSSGASLGNIAVGEQYILKLEHQADHKLSARGRGSYDTNMQPTRGGEQGSGAISHLEFNALLAHGARDMLRDVATVKGEKNDEYWRAVQMGRVTPTPQVPFVFDKLLANLKGGGVNVHVKGHNLEALPVTDDDVSKMSAGEIRKAEFVRAKDFKEIQGGLFDEKVTGGLAGKRWGHIDLAEPVVNPSTKRAVRSLLGITGTKLEAISNGSVSVDVDGKSMTGGKAIQAMLSKIDVDAELKQALEQSKGATGNKLDRLNRKVRYLQALQKTEKRPEQAYIQTKLPVVPPVFRPVYALPNGELRPSGVNLLYGDVIAVNRGLKELNELEGIPDEMKADSRRELAKTVDALAGFSDPLPSTMKRAGGSANLKGFVSEIVGPYPKAGFFQSKVWRRQQELSGRAVAVPNPKLGMDEIELPEDMAWRLYQPFVMKELVALGMKPLDAQKEIEEKTEKAKNALERVMSTRPVGLTRAPALHKFSFLAFMPKLTKEKVVKTPPLIVTGFNLDHDGDTVGIHVPASNEAVKDAYRMLPSRHLILPSTGQPIMVPTMEGIHGLYLLTEETGKSDARFKNLDEAAAAWRSGKSKATEVVTIGTKSTTIGRAILQDVLGSYYDGKKPLTKKDVHAIASRLAKEEPKRYAEVFDQLVSLANEQSYRSGFTVGLEDLEAPKGVKNDFFRRADQRAGRAQKPERVIQAYLPHVNTFSKDAIKELEGTNPNNAFLQMYRSGAKGNPSQMRQVLFSPVMVDGPDGRPIPSPIKKSYAEGLGLTDYWVASYGARKGVMDKTLQVEIPGVFAKRVIASSSSTVIASTDCGTLRGVKLSVDDKNVLDRYLAQPAGGVSRNTLLTPQVTKQLKSKNVREILVRSVLTCELANGVCQRCYGLTEGGKPAEMGANVGVENAQYMSEPTTQAQMRTFHTGGAVGSGFSLQEGFPAIQSLVSMPKVMKGQATLARVTGRVETISPAPAGGWHVTINSERHYVPQQSAVVVKLGERVKKGQRVSTGLIHPQELANLTDARTAQNQMVNDLDEQYKNMGKPLHKRVIETVVRGLTNFGRVLDPGDHDSFVPGDVVPLSHIENHNEKKPGHIIFEPVFKGMVQAPLVQEDWLARMGATNLKTSIEDAATKGQTSSVHGFHPLPAFVFGKEFGKGQGGRY